MANPTLSELLTILRTDVLRDTGSTQKWSDAILTRMLNDGIRQTWPAAFAHVTDSSTSTSQTTGSNSVVYTDKEYTLPSGVPDYPARCPVWKVELGPIGGILASDSTQVSDEYRTLATGLPRDPAWRVDFSRQKLILRDPPWYDSAGTYTYKLRISYVRPIATLSSNSDTLEGPPGLIDYLCEIVRYAAYRYRLNGTLSNVERAQLLGQIMKQAAEEREQLRTRYGVRMAWPQVLR